MKIVVIFLVVVAAVVIADAKALDLPSGAIEPVVESALPDLPVEHAGLKVLDRETRNPCHQRKIEAHRAGHQVVKTKSEAKAVTKKEK